LIRSINLNHLRGKLQNPDSEVSMCINSLKSNRPEANSQDVRIWWMPIFAGKVKYIKVFEFEMEPRASPSNSGDGIPTGGCQRQARMAITVDMNVIPRFALGFEATDWNCGTQSE